MIEFAESTRGAGCVARAVRSGRLSGRILRRLNEKRRAMGLPEVEVRDSLEAARIRAAAAIIAMKTAVAALGRAP